MAEVPVFNCIVHLRPADDGGVHAWVANLAGFECTAGSERQALMQLAGQFKQHVARLHAEGTPIPWIDPPPEPQAGEQRRWVPVHL